MTERERGERLNRLGWFPVLGTWRKWEGATLIEVASLEEAEAREGEHAAATTGEGSSLVKKGAGEP